MCGNARQDRAPGCAGPRGARRGGSRERFPRGLILAVAVAAPCVCSDGNVRAQGAVMLVGGGAESSGGWSDAPYAWFVQQADSGIIINIDVGPVSTWYPSYFISLGASPASHALRIPTVAQANDPSIYADLVSARGIFIEGGDQWQYVATWRNTLVEDAIHTVFSSGGAIGGTSAGCAILGEVVYDARNGSVYPEEAAYNPYDPHITFTDDFLHILPDVITDTHFHARGRLGRLVPFVARRIQDFGDSTLLGIGVEEKTALCVGPDGVATVFGEEVVMVYASPWSTVRCQPATPPTFTAIHFHQLLHGARFHLSSRTLVHPGAYLQPLAPSPSDPSFGALVLNGSSEATASVGEVQVTGMTSSPNAWWYGQLGVEPGQGLVPRSVVVPRLWSNYQYFANRWIGGLLAVALHPHFWAWYLDDGCVTTISPSGTATVGTLTYLVQTRGATHAGVNAYEIPGVVGALLHFLGPGDVGDLLSPSAVSGLQATWQGPGGVTISWEPCQDNVGVWGYLVYASPHAYFPLSQTALLGATGSCTWSLPAPAPGAALFVRVTGVDGMGNESPGSPAAGACSFPLPSPPTVASSRVTSAW